MSSTKKFFKSSMVYFMGNVLTKIISFFLLPLYTTRISTDEYGYFNTSTNYLDILIAILCMEIWSVIMRFMFDYEGRRGKEKAITNGLVIFCVSLLGYCAVFAVLALALDLQYLLLIFIMGLCSMIGEFPDQCGADFGLFHDGKISLPGGDRRVCGADSDAGKKGSFAQGHPS